MTARRLRTKVLIDTFVQWPHLGASGLITAVGSALIDRGPSLARRGPFSRVSERPLRLTFKEVGDAGMV